MNVEEVKTFAQAARARPFIIRLSDGRSLDVGHPEFLAFPRKEGTFVYFPPEGGLMLAPLQQVVYSAEAIRSVTGGIVPGALLDKAGFRPNNIPDAEAVQATLKARPITITAE